MTTTSMYVGPVTRHALEYLISKSGFSNSRIAISAKLFRLLPGISVVLEQLSFNLLNEETEEKYIHFADCHKTIQVSFKPAATVSNSSTYCLGSIPTVQFLAQRSICDYLIWQQLLVESESFTLAGSKITVDSYGHIGKAIACKARELGMLVSISDPDVRHKLEAICDGYNLAQQGSGLDRGIAISVNKLLEEIDDDLQQQIIITGYQDEITATCLYALSALQSMTIMNTQQENHEWWVSECDHLISTGWLKARELI